MLFRSNELTRRYEHGELVTEDSIAFPDSLKFTTLNSKRTVYGGGGIMPDVFVPIDTSMISDYLSKVTREGLVNEFALEYTQDNREKLIATYPTVSDFKNNFDAEKELLTAFVDFAAKNEVEKNEEQINTSKTFLLTRLKATIARNMWDSSAYYQVISDIDNALLKAVEEIKSDTFKKEKLVYK